MAQLVMPLGEKHPSLKARMALGTPDLEDIIGVHQQRGGVGIEPHGRS